jgi:hypothetical protein
LFYWLLDIVLINAFLLLAHEPSLQSHTASGRQKLPISHKDFRLEVAESLIDLRALHAKQRVGNKVRKHTHHCYSKTYHTTELPIDCPHTEICKAKQRECTFHRFQLRQQGKKYTRAPWATFKCVASGCEQFFCQDCIAELRKHGNGQRL